MFFSFFDNEYVAIIGDIIDSKKLNKNDRKIIQNKLKETLDYINERYQDSIASKFMIALGDEFQGLLREQNDIINIVNEIQVAMFPIKIRFGVGIGTINTDINFNNSVEIDGPAYNLAREMIEVLRKKKNQYGEFYSEIMLCSGIKNKEFDTLINSIFSVCSVLKNSWSKRQMEIITTFIEQGYNQYKAAETLKITQSSVNRALKISNYYTYKAAIKNIEYFFNLERGKVND